MIFFEKKDIIKIMLKEIFIWGVARGGNHALIDFILGHLYGYVPDKNYDFQQFWRNHIVLNNYFNDRRYHLDIPLFDLPPFDKRIPPPNPKYGNTQIISYENAGDIEQTNYLYRDLVNILEDYSKLKVNTGRKDTNKYALVILRDPFNWYASYKKGAVDIDKINFTREKALQLIDLWISYAERFFITKGDWFPVRYNLFCQSIEYRKQISQYIDEKFTDEGKKRVSSMGSSFDRHRFDGQANNMKTEERWKYLTQNDIKILDERSKLFELSKKIFNFMPF
jgi:hypothetical protein